MRWIRKLTNINGTEIEPSISWLLHSRDLWFIKTKCGQKERIVDARMYRGTRTPTRSCSRPQQCYIPVVKIIRTNRQTHHDRLSSQHHQIPQEYSGNIRGRGRDGVQENRAVASIVGRHLIRRNRLSGLKGSTWMYQAILCRQTKLVSWYVAPCVASHNDWSKKRKNHPPVGVCLTFWRHVFCTFYQKHASLFFPSEALQHPYSSIPQHSPMWCQTWGRV